MLHYHLTKIGCFIPYQIHAVSFSPYKHHFIFPELKISWSITIASHFNTIRTNSSCHPKTIWISYLSTFAASCRFFISAVFFRMTWITAPTASHSLSRRCIHTIVFECVLDALVEFLFRLLAIRTSTRVLQSFAFVKCLLADSKSERSFAIDTHDGERD